MRLPAETDLAMTSLRSHADACEWLGNAAELLDVRTGRRVVARKASGS